MWDHIAITQSGLHSILNTLYYYIIELKLNVNVSKSKVVSYRNCEKKNVRTWEMGGELTTAGRYIHLNISVCYLTSMKKWNSKHKNNVKSTFCNT